MAFRIHPAHCLEVAMSIRLMGVYESTNGVQKMDERCFWYMESARLVSLSLE